MRLGQRELEAYLVNLAELLERHGVALTKPEPGEDLVIDEDDDGGLSFELLGDLPEGGSPVTTEIGVREAFRPIGSALLERSSYEYELLDRPRGHRRAFHLHFPAWFEREFLVVVHEHCERPVGRVDCEHYEGSPIKDAYSGIGVLMGAWTGDAPDCAELRCLG